MSSSYNLAQIGLYGLNLTTQVNSVLAVSHGGTGTASPSLVSGTGISVTGSWPNQTVAVSGVGTVTSVSGTGTINGLTLTGTVTTTGSLILGGTLSGIANGALTNSSVTIGSTSVSLGATAATVTGLTLTSPTMTAPVLGTPASGNLSSCTADGTNLIGYRNIPQYPFSSASTYTPSTADVGKHIYLTGTGGATIPSGTFAVGDVVTFVNYTSSSISIVTSAVTAYIAGTNTSASPRTLAQRGICTMLCVSANNFVLTGAGLS